jgi:general secretion pathway protein E
MIIKILDLLVSEGILSKQQLMQLKNEVDLENVACDVLLNTIKLETSHLEEVVIKHICLGKLALSDITPLWCLSLSTILRGIADHFHTDVIDLETQEIDISLLEGFNLKQLKKYNTVPIQEQTNHLLVASDDPLNLEVKALFERRFPQKPIKVALASPSHIEKQLEEWENQENLNHLIASIRQDMAKNSPHEVSETSPVFTLIEHILNHTIEVNASDIHIEVIEKHCQVRQRVDGVLRIGYLFDKDIFSPLASRIKLLASLDITERRKPQDGRFSQKVGGRVYDFRVSTLPITEEESIVLRVLDASKPLITLADAGMNRDNFTKFSQAIEVPHGIVLVTGPTGSGKTTTLYGALNTLQSDKEKIITVEDPVEYQMAGLQQVQVNPTIGVGFLEALRAILRQDPDKIMIGEIRDKETLRTAIQAALTGHLVLSTLHTNDAISAITRALDMEIEPYLLSGALVAIEAQRLVRNICHHCKEETTLPTELYKRLIPYLPRQFKIYEGKGCRACGFSGYSGREMVSEVLTISKNLSRLIAQNASRESLLKQAKYEGFNTMFEDGLVKVLEGKTTIKELYRVTKLV